MESVIKENTDCASYESLDYDIIRMYSSTFKYLMSLRACADMKIFQYWAIVQLPPSDYTTAIILM
jgi:hypothetical protein